MVRGRSRAETPRPPQNLVSVSRPRPVNSLVAAARRITAKDLGDRYARKNTRQAWQDDAWDMFDLVGEHHYLITNLANKTKQAYLFAGKKSQDDTEKPEVEKSGPAFEAWQEFVENTRLDELLYKAKVNMGVTGDGYLIGIHKDNLGNDDSDDDQGTIKQPVTNITPIGVGNDEGPDIQDLKWGFYSVSEVQFEEDSVKITNETSKPKTYPIKSVYVIRVWKPHPRRAWWSDSPTRGALPILREIAGLTMAMGANIDSRLAGAGMLLVPQEAADALDAQSGLDEESSDDPFLDSLIDSMLTPIGDRSNASAVVPLVVKVPGETIAQFKFMSFATPMDAKAGEDRTQALARLGASMDAPPEMMTGVSKTNHWGAWLVSEDTIRSHVEPDLAVLCDAITTGYLWPVLEAGGMDPEEAHEYVIWYDVEHLIIRTGMAADAQALYKLDVISDESLRDATGFDESDAPNAGTEDPALIMALAICRESPQLFASPGLLSIADQIRRALAGETGPTPIEDLGKPATGGPTGEGGQPNDGGGSRNIPDTLPNYGVRDIA